ncbi:Putative peptidoglycan binding domain-containing protein [Palleronia marisminoris]|uniref:Putative peptidoglycan binding domain protein n=2 Tax=Palleronia marisminoris TaxID=315423 RepID=A0A1Y5SFA0_9RHOB|nr:trypsin-like peptidase domain-containing protein [Palleronia marisminoris]SFG80182.1 Putative peptidoglycan binding domain-containing protein [Palleronia marisminoris]SLN39453.1 Putative peptidoglycan binding domain protein [Palleronia marisminoris]
MTAVLASLAAPAWAQDTWLQVEAQSNAPAAIETAREFAGQIDGVAAFDLNNSSWFAVAIGPFTPEEAAQQRRSLRARQLIPSDSFTTDGSIFGEAIWPEGGVETAQADTLGEAARVMVPEAEPQQEPQETLAEARESESLLIGPEREALQVALQWAGYYDGPIDAAFGRGTRGSMAEWQAANGYDDTGVLTTQQRAELLAQYNAVLDGLGMANVIDSTAGVTVQMPTELVAFDRYQPPFAHYEPRNGADPQAKVLLISQAGEQADLYGLYDVMQTLEIVPPEGERERRQSGFTLVGQGDDIVSHTEARLENGEIKGFTLIWPAGDEDRSTRVLDEMLASFETTAGVVMPDEMGEPTEDQSVDLLAGLEIRRPELVRSGFFVSRRGDVLTTADVAQGCERITLEDGIEATVTAADAERGLALLEPGQALAPRQHATFREGVPRLNTEVVLSGYSFEGQLGAPSMTYGTLAAMEGLDGAEDVRRYALEARPGDAGGPVFDNGGQVLGLLQPEGELGRSLPDGVAFATDVDTIEGFLSGAGLTPSTAPLGEDLPLGQMERRATDMTVLVGCWR